MPKTITASLESQDTITFSISWSPKAEDARLSSLSCNDIAVAFSQKPISKGEIRVVFDAPRAAIYRFQWSLLFSKKTFKNLKATAQRGDSAVVEVDTFLPEKKARWEGSKAVNL